MTRLAPLVSRLSLISGMLMLVGRAAAGQLVGHPPTSSPYLDLEYAQEFSIIAGNYHAHRDPADVGPQSGLLLGAHYEWRATGPLHLIGEITRMNSERNQLDPLKVGSARILPTVNRPLYSASFALGMSLTGGKSWHHFVPEVTGGLGLVSDLRSQPDSGGFKFGTRFALTWGAGIRWVPGGHWQVRGDLTNHSYTVAYPEAYFVAPAGGNAIASSSQSKSFWTNNPAFTLGLSRLF
ncbi:MAG: hypothetical protein ACREPM_03460 [Gemmatimonadaceae bacterium]